MKSHKDVMQLNDTQFGVWIDDDEWENGQWINVVIVTSHARRNLLFVLQLRIIHNYIMDHDDDAPCA